jgi:hypothetical protein
MGKDDIPWFANTLSDPSKSLFVYKVAVLEINSPILQIRRAKKRYAAILLAKLILSWSIFAVVPILDKNLGF